MTKALELAKFGRESAPTGLVVGDSDAQTLSQKTFSDMPTFSSGTANSLAYLNGSKVLTADGALSYDGTTFSTSVSVNSQAASIYTRNTNTGTSAWAGLTIGNDISNNRSGILVTSSNRTASGFVGPQSTYLYNSIGLMSIVTESNNPIYIGTNNTTRITVLGGGNVGVGIQAPTAIIHTQSSGLGDGGGIKLGNSGSGGGTFAIWPTATINGEGADKLIFSGSGGNLVTITGAGKVGIGTTIPQLQLDLGSATSNRGISWGGTSGNYVNIWTTYGGADLNIGTNVKPSGNNTGYYSSYADTGTARNIIRLNAFNGNGIQFFTDTQSSVAVDTGVTPSERMRITPAGLVGIGTQTPTTVLDVVKAATISTTDFIYSTTPTLMVQTPSNSTLNTAAIMLRATDTANAVSAGSISVVPVANYRSNFIFTYDADASGGNIIFNQFHPSNATTYERLRVDSNGNVAIGVNTVSDSNRRLTLSGTNSLATKLYLTNTESSSGIELIAGGSNGYGINAWDYSAIIEGTGGTSGTKALVLSAYNGPMVFQTNSRTERMRILGAGQVIIGDTSAQYSSKLYVNGAIAARHGGVDGTYQPAFIAGYTSNYTEANVISTAVSSDGNGSGFRFEVSDGAGLASRTSTVWFKRYSAYFNTSVGINGQLSIGGNSLYFEKSGTRSWQLYANQSTGQAWLASGDGAGTFTIASEQTLINTSVSITNASFVVNGGSSLSGQFIGQAKNTLNMGTGAVIMHKLGQSQGFQFSGKIVANSWTGQAYVDVHIIAYYTNDAISYQVLQASTLNPSGAAKIVLQLATVTIGGSSYLAITKNGGGTGTIYIDGACQNNTGFFYEVASGGYTVTTTHATLN